MHDPFLSIDLGLCCSGMAYDGVRSSKDVKGSVVLYLLGIPNQATVIKVGSSHELSDLSWSGNETGKVNTNLSELVCKLTWGLEATDNHTWWNEPIGRQWHSRRGRLFPNWIKQLSGTQSELELTLKAWQFCGLRSSTCRTWSCLSLTYSLL